MKKISIKRIHFSFLVLLLTIPSGALAIVGGQFSSISEFPFIIHRYGCGRTKVAPDLLITAAHCVSFEPGKGFRALLHPVPFWFGSDSSDKIEIPLEILTLHIHPQYFKNAGNTAMPLEQIGPDIAFIRIKRTAEFDKIPIAGLNFAAPKSGQEVVIIGYGAYIDNLMHPEELAGATLDYDHPIKGNGALKKAYTTISYTEPWYIHTSDFDSAGKSVRVASGDSGSPLLVRNSHGSFDVIGIAAARKPGGGDGRFTRLDSLSAWIERILKDKDAGVPIITD